MGDFLLSVFHSTFDSQRNKGCLSLYYSNYIPIISFSRYSSQDNDDIQEYPFPTISYISIYTEKEGDNCLNVFVKDQLFSASIFHLPSKNDLLSFIQITVSNGILNSGSNRQNPNKWIPVCNLKPRDPIQWICDNSPNTPSTNFSLSSIYHNSHPPFYRNSTNISFSLPNHREILRDLIEKGKQTDIYKKLNQLSLKSEFEKRYFNIRIDQSYSETSPNHNIDESTYATESNPKQNPTQNTYTNDTTCNNPNQTKSSLEKVQNDTRLFEYITIRKQWENRISHQNLNNSKHNNDVEKILKDLPRTISKEKTIILLYNVLRTFITYAPDVGFAQGMADLSYFIAQVVLDDIEKVDDDSQSKVFWGLTEILFIFGQSDWFLAFNVANSKLIDVIDQVLNEVYPSMALFVRCNDFEVFKHSFGSILTMFTRMFSREILEKLWLMIFLKEKVQVFHAAVLAALFVFNFQKLSESKAKDMSHIADLMNSNYLVENEDSFLAVVASICEMISTVIDVKQESFDEFSCSLFKPLEI